MNLEDHTAAKFETVERFVDIVEDVEQAIIGGVRYDRLSEDRDWTWHKAEHKYEGIPNMIL